MATVERIITGPTTNPDVSWLVVLYRSIEVAHGTQLIGYMRSISEQSYSRLTPDELDYYVGDTWTGAIDEPPGTSLPDEHLNPDGIAWWLATTEWSAETGPTDSGLPATRTYLLDPPPRVLRAMIFQIFDEEFGSTSRPTFVKSRPSLIFSVSTLISCSTTQPPALPTRGWLTWQHARARNCRMG